jgi:hypothetical protein
MTKVTLLIGVFFLKILLFNGCNEDRGGISGANHQGSREEIRYENKLDSQYERKIDSAYKQMGKDCDSALAAEWKAISDSLIQSHHVKDSLVADSIHMRDSVAHP